MSKTATQLLRSVYRLLDRSPGAVEIPPEVWEGLKGEIETYLVENWQPVTFITHQSALNEKINSDKIVASKALWNNQPAI